MKFEIKKIVLLILIAWFVSSCGESGGGSKVSGSALDNTSEDIDTIPSPESKSIEMQLNKLYSIDKGQTIVKKVEGTVIVVKTDIESGESQVILKSGAATIER